MARVGYGVAVLASLILAAEVLALGGDHPAGQKIPAEYNKEWPKGLVDLANTGDRVWGHWVNQGDFFYYKGDPAALNKFLAAYGQLSDTPLAVVLHAGSKPTTGPLGGERDKPYDWQLEVMRRGWGAPLDPRQPAATPGYVVTVHVWLTDALPLDKIEVPKHVEVRSAGDIEGFIQRHRSR